MPCVGYKFSAEAVAKRRAYRATTATKAKQSASLKEFYGTYEYPASARAAISARFKGIPKSLEHRANMSAGMKGKYGGEKCHFWRGGRSIHVSGYVCITSPDGTIKRELEHRVVAEKALGRKLKSTEVVHHINGDKADNRNCNLLICTNSYHRLIEARMVNLYQAEHFGGKA